MDLLFQEHGYEIFRDGERIVCVDRGTWILSYVAGILGVVSFLLLLVGVLALSGAMQTMSAASTSGLLVGAGITLAGSISLGRAGRRRSRIPVAEVAGRIEIDFAGGRLLVAPGGEVASLDGVRVTDRFDWATRGVSRVVVVRWTGGRRIVFRTIHRQRARDVARLLSRSGSTST